MQQGTGVQCVNAAHLPWGRASDTTGVFAIFIWYLVRWVRGEGRSLSHPRRGKGTRRSMRREERVTVQGSVKKQQPNGPHAHGNTARQVVDEQNAEGSGQQKRRNDSHTNKHNPSTPTTGLRQRENNTSRNRGRRVQHAKGRTGDCPGPCEGSATRRNATQGGWNRASVSTVQVTESRHRRRETTSVSPRKLCL